MSSDGFRVLAAPMVVVVVGFCTGSALGQFDRTWNDPLGGDWNDDTNWNGGGQPDTPIENAIIALAGPYTVTLGVDRTIGNINLVSPGSTLALSSILTMVGTHTQQGMTITGGTGAAVNVNGLATLRNATLTNLPAFNTTSNILFDGPGDTSILNSRISHTGTVGTWQGTGNLIFGGGAVASGLTFGSTSVFTITNNQTASWNNSGTRPDLTNAGTLNKNGGTGITSVLGVRLNNTGTVRASTGTFRFDNVANFAAGVLTGGTWRVENGATLDLVGQSITTNRATVELNGANSVFAGINTLQTNDAAGILRLQGGRMFTAQSAFTNAGRVDLSAGSVLRVTQGNTFTNSNQINGAGQTSVLLTEGPATFQGGALVGLTYMSMGSLRITGGAPIVVDDTCFDHNGFGCDWDGTGGITVGGGSAFSFGSNSQINFSNQQTMAWNNLGTRPTFSFEGTMRKTTSSTTTSITGVEYSNNGHLLVQSGTLRTDTVQNLSGGTLTGGIWEVKNNAALDFAAQSITTNSATVILEGNSVFNAFNALNNNTSAGVFDVQNGKTFVTQGNMTNNGTIFVTSETAPALFKVATGFTLTNYNPINRTITGGSFEVKGSGRDSGTVEIDGLDIATLNAGVSLDGPGANIVDPTASGDQNALRNLAVVDDAGAMAISNGKNFDTLSDLDVEGAGRLAVGVDSTFNVSGNLANFDSAGRFSDGDFTLSGTLRSDNALLVTLATKLDLANGARLERPDGAGGFTDALPTMASIVSEGDFTLREGRALTLQPHTLETFTGSALTIGLPTAPGDTFLRVQGDFKHAGTLSLVQGGDLRIDGGSTNNGVVRGDGTISIPSGRQFVNNSLIAPGIPADAPFPDPTGLLRITGGGDLLINETATVRIDIFALGIGTGHDHLRVDARLLFADDAAGRLEVIVDPSYIPVEGDTFEILRFDGGSVGWFDQIVIPPIFDQIREPNRFLLVVLPTPGAGAVLVMAGVLAMRRRR